jgi:RNA polymerase sigma-70 factor, ECF subfamily
LSVIHGENESLEELARAAVDSDAAFERLVRRCYDRIHRWALVATGDADEADDVAQETLLRMHRGLAGFRGDARFTSWLYRLTRSAVADLGRRRAGRTRTLLRLVRRGGGEHEPAPPVVARIETERRVALVRAFWRDLPRRQREIFDLADLQGHSPGEIAEMLEMKPVTVRAHLFKARRTIRQRMLEAEPVTTEGDEE